MFRLEGYETSQLDPGALEWVCQGWRHTGMALKRPRSRIDGLEGMLG